MLFLYVGERYSFPDFSEFFIFVIIFPYIGLVKKLKLQSSVLSNHAKKNCLDYTSSCRSFGNALFLFLLSPVYSFSKILKYKIAWTLFLFSSSLPNFLI